MVNIAVPQTPRRAGGTDCNGDCDVGGLGGRPVSATDLLRDAGWITTPPRLGPCVSLVKYARPSCLAEGGLEDNLSSGDVNLGSLGSSGAGWWQQARVPLLAGPPPPPPSLLSLWFWRPSPPLSDATKVDWRVGRMRTRGRGRGDGSEGCLGQKGLGGSSLQHDDQGGEGHGWVLNSPCWGRAGRRLTFWPIFWE